jgi:hypothetical protein
LGIVLSRPGGQVEVKDVVPGERELEQVGEESWHRSMWPLISVVLVFFFAFIVVIIILIISRCYSFVSKPTESDKGPPEQIPLPGSISYTRLFFEWKYLYDKDFTAFEDPKDPTPGQHLDHIEDAIRNDVDLLNRYACGIVPIYEINDKTQTSLILKTETGSVKYSIRAAKSVMHLYIGLYSSMDKNVPLSYDYIIYWDVDTIGGQFDPNHEYYAEPLVFDYTKESRTHRKIYAYIEKLAWLDTSDIPGKFAKFPEREI